MKTGRTTVDERITTVCGWIEDSADKLRALMMMPDRNAENAPKRWNVLQEMEYSLNDLVRSIGDAAQAVLRQKAPAPPVLRLMQSLTSVAATAISVAQQFEQECRAHARPTATGTIYTDVHCSLNDQYRVWMVLQQLQLSLREGGVSFRAVTIDWR